MQFLSTIFSFAALVSLAASQSVSFINQDSTQRTIVFTANAGLESIDDLVIEGLSTANQSFPEAWIGNFYSVSEGATNVPGMLGEVRFGGYAGATYFDVSAIVNPEDTDGVHELFPLDINTPVSGCETFPCTNLYTAADDIATLSTPTSDLVCLLGNLANTTTTRRSTRVARKYVLE